MAVSGCASSDYEAAGSKPNIMSDIKNLSDEIVCWNATHSLGGTIQWALDSFSAKFINESKNRGLSCGVKEQETVKESNQTPPAVLDDSSEVSTETSEYKTKQKPSLSLIGSAQASALNKTNDDIGNKLDQLMIYAIERLIDIGLLPQSKQSKLQMQLEKMSKSRYERIFSICQKGYENLEPDICDNELLKLN